MPTGLEEGTSYSFFQPSSCPLNRFYDTGRKIQYLDEAISLSNQLIYQESTGNIQGTYNKKTYTLTEVIKTN